MMVPACMPDAIVAVVLAVEYTGKDSVLGRGNLAAALHRVSDHPKCIVPPSPTQSSVLSTLNVLAWVAASDNCRALA